MNDQGPHVSRIGLHEIGLRNTGTVYWNLPAAQLVEHAIQRGEAMLAAEGPVVALTGSHTGRSPADKFLVRHGDDDEIWWGSVNRPLLPEHFDHLRRKVAGYVQGRDLFVLDAYAGADARYRLPVRVVTELAWHNHFARNMFLVERDGDKLADFEPAFTVIDVPGCKADPQADGTRSSTFIVLDFGSRTVLIGGTAYAGEIKKSIFSVMNYLLPRQGVFSMHCSCNYGRDRHDVALFFGLSGTGKTTLSADPERTLIGDDEHGWSDEGIFNIEGGCYAKVINLSREGEPDIWRASRRFGTVLENVVCDGASRRVRFDDGSLTENTRSSYPITHLAKVDPVGRAGHPKNVVFLTCDAFGVLPPISRLTEAQAMYHFLSGYTAKVAGTERGVTEPAATFSTCFGAPFLPLHPSVYARMLGERLAHHRAAVWLVNTGWSGGPYGVGQRMKLAHTRRIVAAALGGELSEVSTVTDPVFGVAVPTEVDGVPRDVLQPRQAWSDVAAYDDQAARLARMFADNFRQFEGQVDAAVASAGPQVD